MDFKQWFEALDIQNAPTDHLDFGKYGDHYISRFFVGNSSFIVNFEPDEYGITKAGKIDFYYSDHQDQYVVHFLCWVISFRGPAGYSTTNSGKNMFLIYKNLLLSIKKLMQAEKVESLDFSGYNENQDIMYMNFYKKYLYPNFVFLTKKTLISQDLSKRIQQALHTTSGPETATGFSNKLDQRYLDKVSQIRDFRNEKNKIRNLNPSINNV